ASASHRFFSERRQALRVAFGPPIFHLEIAALGVAERTHSFDEGGSDLRVGSRAACPQESDPGALGRCLGTRRERPNSRAAEQRHELAAFHSITSSASASSVGGISRPSALEVLRLITNSNLVD